jgi:hypothetical protein
VVVTQAGTTVTWTRPIAPGATVSVAYSVIVSWSANPGDQLHNLVVSGDPGANCSSVTADPALCSTITTVVAQAAASPIVASTVPVTG